MVLCISLFILYREVWCCRIGGSLIGKRKIPCIVLYVWYNSLVILVLKFSECYLFTAPHLQGKL